MELLQDEPEEKDNHRTLDNRKRERDDEDVNIIGAEAAIVAVGDE